MDDDGAGKRPTSLFIPSEKDVDFWVLSDGEDKPVVDEIAKDQPAAEVKDKDKPVDEMDFSPLATATSTVAASTTTSSTTTSAVVEATAAAPAATSALAQLAAALLSPSNAAANHTIPSCVDFDSLMNSPPSSLSSSDDDEISESEPETDEFVLPKREEVVLNTEDKVTVKQKKACGIRNREPETAQAETATSITRRGPEFCPVAVLCLFVTFLYVMCIWRHSLNFQKSQVWPTIHLSPYSTRHYLRPRDGESVPVVFPHESLDLVMQVHDEAVKTSTAVGFNRMPNEYVPELPMEWQTCSLQMTLRTYARFKCPNGLPDFIPLGASMINLTWILNQKQSYVLSFHVVQRIRTMFGINVDSTSICVSALEPSVSAAATSITMVPLSQWKTCIPARATYHFGEENYYFGYYKVGWAARRNESVFRQHSHHRHHRQQQQQQHTTHGKNLPSNVLMQYIAEQIHELFPSEYSKNPWTMSRQTTAIPCILSIPVEWTQVERMTLLRAATRGGLFDIKQVVPAPVAIALSHFSNAQSKATTSTAFAKNVIVYQIDSAVVVTALTANFTPAHVDSTANFTPAHVDSTVNFTPAHVDSTANFTPAHVDSTILSTNTSINTSINTTSLIKDAYQLNVIGSSGYDAAITDEQWNRAVYNGLMQKMANELKVKEDVMIWNNFDDEYEIVMYQVEQMQRILLSNTPYEFRFCIHDSNATTVKTETTTTTATKALIATTQQQQRLILSTSVNCKTLEHIKSYRMPVSVGDLNTWTGAIVSKALRPLLTLFDWLRARDYQMNQQRDYQIMDQKTNYTLLVSGWRAQSSFFQKLLLDGLPPTVQVQMYRMPDMSAARGASSFLDSQHTVQMQKITSTPIGIRVYPLSSPSTPSSSAITAAAAAVGVFEDDPMDDANDHLQKQQHQQKQQNTMINDHHAVIPQFTPYPTKKGQWMYNVSASVWSNQRVMILEIYEGFSANTKYNVPLQRFEIQIPRKSSVATVFELDFAIDNQSLLAIHVRPIVADEAMLITPHEILHLDLGFGIGNSSTFTDGQSFYLGRVDINSTLPHWILDESFLPSMMPTTNVNDDHDINNKDSPSAADGKIGNTSSPFYTLLLRDAFDYAISTATKFAMVATTTSSNWFSSSSSSLSSSASVATNVSTVDIIEVPPTTGSLPALRTEDVFPFDL